MALFRRQRNAFDSIAESDSGGREKGKYKEIEYITAQQIVAILSVVERAQVEKTIKNGSIWTVNGNILDGHAEGHHFTMKFDHNGITFGGTGRSIGHIEWQDVSKRLCSRNIQYAPKSSPERARVAGMLLNIYNKLRSGESGETPIEETLLTPDERKATRKDINQPERAEESNCIAEIQSIGNRYEELLDFFCDPKNLKNTDEKIVKEKIETAQKGHKILTQQLGTITHTQKKELTEYLEGQKCVEKSGEKIWCLNACIAIHKHGEQYSLHNMSNEDLDKTLWGIYDGVNAPDFFSWENAKEIGKNIAPLSAEWEDIKNIRQALGRNHTMEAVGHGVWLIIDTVSDVATALVTVGTGGTGLPVALAARIGGKALAKSAIKGLMKMGVRASKIRKTLAVAKTAEGVTKTLKTEFKGHRNKPFHLDDKALDEGIMTLPRSQISAF